MRLSFMVALLATLGGSWACDDKSKGAAPTPSTTAAPLETAQLTARTAELAETLVVGSRAPLALPPDDLPLPLPTEMTREANRIAYKTAGGKMRVVYVVGSALFVGARADSVEWGKIPSWEEARKGMYADGRRRDAVIGAVRDSVAEPAFAKFLFDVADVPDAGEWLKAADAMTVTGKAELVKLLAPVVTAKGTPHAGLRRAVLFVDLQAQPASIQARLEELLTATPVVADSGALAIMLRALAKEQPKEAASLACIAMRAVPKSELETSPLANTAALVIFKAQSTCAELSNLLAASTCATAVRCSDKGLVRPGETTAQDEPLCTKAQVEKAAEIEFARTPRDLLKDEYVPGAAFALAMASETPTEFQQAHARRLFKITQPKTPECDSDIKEGTPCHCQEAQIRAQVCRTATPKVSTGTCAFQVDEAKKTIDKVTASRTGIVQ